MSGDKEQPSESQRQLRELTSQLQDTAARLKRGEISRERALLIAAAARAAVAKIEAELKSDGKEGAE
jgi:phage-related tail protein